MTSSPPLVSVAMITHNHARYIQQAIDGVLMQLTDFAFELVIGLDSSDDNTHEHIRSQQTKAPDKIIVLPASEQKMGMKLNLWRTLQACRGSYIAFCEGDDFWTDPGKLQKQVDILQSNPEYSACFHRFSAADQWGRPLNKPYRRPPDILLTRHILWHLYSRTCTVIYSKASLSGITLSEFERFPHPDYYLALIASIHGKAAYLDENMATYRFHTGGVASSMAAAEKFKRSELSRKLALEIMPLNSLEKMVGLLAILKYRLARFLAWIKLIR